MSLREKMRVKRQQLIERYSKLATAGNWAWRRVENLQGYDGDYIPEDAGMGPGDIGTKHD